jgi:hypothetical protein
MEKKHKNIGNKIIAEIGVATAIGGAVAIAPIVVNQYDKQNVYQQTSQSKIPSKRARNTDVELDRIVRLKSAGTKVDTNYIGIPRLK